MKTIIITTFLMIAGLGITITTNANATSRAEINNLEMSSDLAQGSTSNIFIETRTRRR